MKEKLLEATQKFSRAIIQPVMFLSVTGIVLAISVLMKLESMPAAVRKCGEFLYNLLMNGNMNQLSVIFCVGITVALAKRKKGDAAVLGLIAFLLFIYANNAWLKISGTLIKPTVNGFPGTGQTMTLGVQTIDMGVFLGIILGCITGYVFNKFCNVEFIDVFRVYGGSRLVYMIMIPVVIVLAIVLSYVWPAVNWFITAAGGFMSRSGALGVFIYGFLNRFLIPIGMHHLVYMPFKFTQLGGSITMGGKTIAGATYIWAAQLGNLSHITALDPSSRFLTFGFSKVFGCTGIALAFIKTAKPEKKKITKGLIIPALFVAVIAGITEPFEFAFLFISPLLWFVHSALDGLFEVLLYVFGVRVSMHGGLLATIAENLPVPVRLTKVYILVILGFIAIGVWYFIFTFLIKKLDIKTPGREDDGETVSLASRNIEEARAKAKTTKGNGEKSLGDIKDIVEGLGGAQNIITVNNCFTRLRVDVKDMSLINDDAINKFKNSGIVKKGHNVQIIIGMKVQTVREDVCQYLNIE